MNKELEGKIREIIGEAVGHGSMCWEPIPAGVFDSTEAGKSVDLAFARIAALMPEPLPHIICLAEAHYYRLRPAMTAKAWVISLVRRGDRKDKHVFSGETFWEAERKTREYLEKLEDKK